MRDFNLYYGGHPDYVSWKESNLLRDCEDFIEAELRNCVINTIARLEAEDTHRPFHAALLSEEALFWSRFERSFSTSFGQRVIEQISKAAAISGGAQHAQNQRETTVVLPQSRLSAIEKHVEKLRRKGSREVADWDENVRSLSLIEATPNVITLSVISDLWWSKDGIESFMSIKTVKPNIDQTAEAKRDLLKLKLAFPAANVYYGLYYNPYGERRLDYAWGPPKKIFNFNTDPAVLIGREYWDVLGGHGFYDELLVIAGRVGEGTRNLVSNLR